MRPPLPEGYPLFILGCAAVGAALGCLISCVAIWLGRLPQHRPEQRDDKRE